MCTAKISYLTWVLHANFRWEVTEIIVFFFYLGHLLRQSDRYTHNLNENVKILCHSYNYLPDE